MAANRERILEAARALMAGDAAGFALEAVASASGVARPTVYRHFGSRAALMRAVLATVSDESRVRSNVNAALRETDVSVATRAFVDSAVKLWQTETALVRAAVQLRADPEIATVTKAADRSRHEDARVIAMKAQSGLRASELAYALTLLTSPESYLLLVDQLGLTPSRARKVLRSVAEELMGGA